MSGSDSLTGPAIIADVEQGQDRMAQDTDVIALVGAGDPGLAILRALLGVPGVEVRYVFDADPAAPGVALARDHGIRCRTDGRFDDLTGDAEVDLILETGGDADVLAALEASRHPDSCLIGAAGMPFVSRLLAEITDVRRRANVEKARYLRQASHQVKSPLSSIQTYVNVILGGYTGEIPERTRDIVEKIHSRCDAALGALAKRRMLADLRCIDGDGLEMSTVRLGEMIDQAVARYAEAAAGRDIEIRVPPHHGPDLVRCSPPQMLALLSELLENALVYSHDGGLVEIALASLSDGRLALSVRDHGIGIPERCLPRIFDEDYRADLAVKHHQDGAGLGLAIAREIADLHRFGLAAESKEGHGSVFTVTVPDDAPAA
jgi:signal transduction histidine kinase